MKKTEKVERLEVLKELFQKNETFIVTELSGVTANSINELRSQLNNENIQYTVVKNTLTRIALKETGRESLGENFTGNNAIAFTGADPVKAAKIFTKYSKDEKEFNIKFGVLDQDFLDASKVEQLAELPDYDTVLTKFATLLVTPLTNFARVLNEPISSFARSLKQLSEKSEEN